MSNVTPLRDKLMTSQVVRPFECLMTLILHKILIGLIWLLLKPLVYTTVVLLKVFSFEQKYYIQPLSVRSCYNVYQARGNSRF